MSGELTIDTSVTQCCWLCWHAVEAKPFEAFICCTLVLHYIDLTNVGIHKFEDVFNICMDVIFILCVHRFGCSSGRGVRIVNDPAYHVNFVLLEKQSRKIGAGHWIACSWPIT